MIVSREITPFALSEFKYIAPVETLVGYRTLTRYVKRYRLPPEQVLILSLRDDLTALLQSQGSPILVAGRTEVPGIEATIAAANEDIARLEDTWQQAVERSDFFWAILWQFQAEYLLHLRTSISVAEYFLKIIPPTAIWLITPAGLTWGSGADQFGDRNPLWYLAIRANLKAAGRTVRTIGAPVLDWPSFLIGLLVLRFVLNSAVLITVSLANRLLGVCQALVFHQPRKKGAPRVILAFFHEPFSIAPVPAVIQELKRQHIGLHRVLHANIGRLQRKQLLSDAYTLYKNIVAILTRRPECSYLGRLDNRLRLSSWLFIYLQGIRRIGWRDYSEAVNGGRGQLRLIEREVKSLLWVQAKRYATLTTYTRLILLNYLPEYVFSFISLRSLVREVQPRLVVYPDGYNMIIRLAQVLGQKYNYLTAQVPHGYPNRTFPQYYYRADHYLTPNQLSAQQLQDVGRDIHRIHYVRNEILAASIKPRATRPPEPLRVGLVYSGSYEYWSFPNLYAELLAMSEQLIKEIRQQLPEARIILKSHPNGTSPYFFAALTRTFAHDFATGLITHIAKGWSNPEDWEQLTAAIAPIIFPSTPTIQFLSSGIPLVFIAGSHYTPTRNMYYPHHRNVKAYPFSMPSVEAAVMYLKGLVGNEELLQQAQQEALAYATKSSIPPAGTPHRSLAEVFAGFVNQPY